MRRHLFRAASIALIAAAAISTAQAQQTTSAKLGTWGVDLANMDRSVAPGEDFFSYVNGAWVRTATIPPDRGRFGAFDELRFLSEERSRDIVEELITKADAALSTEERKLRDLYAGYIDVAGIEARGIAAAKPDLDRIAALKSLDDVARAMGSRRVSSGSPFSVGIGVNDKNADEYVVRLYQAGLGMPDRDYYLRDDKALAATREAYEKHLATVLKMLGLDNVEVRAKAVYDLEHQMAEAHWANAERREAEKMFNPMPMSELQKLAPGFPWPAYFKAAGITPRKGKTERQVIVSEKSAFPKLAAIFAETPVAVWRDYMTLHYVHNYASVLPKAFDEEDFDFYGKTLQGNAQQLDRKVRAARLVDRVLGEALGKIYVARHFPPEAKAKAEQLVANLLKVYEDDIRVLPWMTETTRQKALIKLHKFTPHIGYPDKWRDYAALEIKRDDPLGNLHRNALFNWNRNLKRIDQKTDRTEWFMSPPTVNAYYESSFNVIVFPAAILQPPFFDPNADDAVNYGGIGAVIGHEISHGFDDQGSKYDGDGKLENWWTVEDRASFEKATKALGQQYNSYEALPGLHVNGAFTMGENIADLSGISVALKAYHLSLGGNPAPLRDGLTGDQRFFLSFGQIWRTKVRENTLRQQILTDAHSPGNFRVIGPTRNVDAWYDAFGIKPTDKYYLAPADRVRLW